MSTEPKMSRLRLAIEKMDEAESKLKRQARDIELQDASHPSPETQERLAELTASIAAIQSARELLGQLHEENRQP